VLELSGDTDLNTGEGKEEGWGSLALRALPEYFAY